MYVTILNWIYSVFFNEALSIPENYASIYEKIMPYACNLMAFIMCILIFYLPIYMLFRLFTLLFKFNL